MQTAKLPLQKSRASSPREFLSSFNYFRGVSILIIVAGHCFGMVGWQRDGVSEEIFFNLISGGTSLFVFISGFLFHHIFYEHFKYKKFLISKFRNVFLPYLFMSIFPISLSFFGKSDAGEFSGYFFAQGQGFWVEYLRPVLLFIWTGRASTAYWYIPFVMLLFCLSPFFIAYINSNLRLRNFFFFISLSISIVIHRPIGNILVIQSLFYFLPVYLLGIQSSIHRDFIYRRLKNKEPLLALLAVVCAILQSTVFHSTGNFEKSAFVITVPDIVIIQKLLLCLFFMVFLHRFESVQLPLLNRIASASFAIFFLHPLVIKVFRFVLERWEPAIPGFLAWAIFTPLVVLCCYSIATVVKKTFPSFSRMLIGW
jgi:probable poly-beta-1,6-N-acetyl-D-glucosamine export protein